MILVLNPDNISVTIGGSSSSGTASSVFTNASVFDGNLSPLDTNVQLALETLDKLVISGGTGTVKRVQNILPDGNGNVDLTGVLVKHSEIQSSIQQSSILPVSGDAVYNSLLNKVSVEYGKGLSTNDYTVSDKNVVSSLSTFNPNTKVDKEVGKYLFSGSYNDLLDKPSIQAPLGYTAENVAKRGVANGYAPTNSYNKIDAQYLPSYVDDFLEYPTFADFPLIGETGIVYLDVAENKQYRWSGSQYNIIAQSPGSTDSITEGSTNLYFTTPRVLNTILSSVSFVLSSSISDTDSVLTAFGKLQSQVNNKVTAVSGKGLSDQNYTIEEKNKLATLSYIDTSSWQSQLDGKVDKEIGKGLFSGSYSDLSNKPVIDNSPTQGSSNLISSGAVYTAILESSSGGGTTDHNVLLNRSTADQHPISAITGLQTALDNAGGVSTVNNISPVNKNITLTSDDVTEGSTNRYVTTSDETKLSNLSGTNTGDETKSSIETKLGASSLNTTSKEIVGSINETFTTANTEMCIISLSGVDGYLFINSAAEIIPCTFSWQLVSLTITCTTAPTGSIIAVDILKNGVSIFTVKPNIEAGEFSSSTSATPYVLVTTPTTISAGDVVTFQITGVGTIIPGKNLKAHLLIKKL